jgi:hypothetical protein
MTFHICVGHLKKQNSFLHVIKTNGGKNHEMSVMLKYGKQGA